MDFYDILDKNRTERKEFANYLNKVYNIGGDDMENNNNLYLKQIKTVLLDIDGTVMDFHAGQRKAFFASVAEMQEKADEDVYLTFDEVNKSYWKKFERGEIAKEVLIFERFRTLRELKGIPKDEYAFEKVYQRLLGEQCIYIDGAEKGVEYLSGKYKVYIVTNGVKHTQLNRIKKSGLSSFTDGVFISEEVGYQKPQKEFFDYVFAKTGADRKTSVIIGDSPSSDIQGGINAGIKTVRFNPSGIKEEPYADAEVASWEELCKLL